MLGLLFISLHAGCETEADSIRFGENPGLGHQHCHPGAVACLLILAFVGFLYRPLLFSSLDEDVAEAKGMPMLSPGTAFMIVVEWLCRSLCK